jgi:hypothetical protein
MCVTTKDCKPIANGLIMNRQDVYEVFPDLVQRIDPNFARPGHCLLTGVPMSRERMYPRGLTPRHMTDAAYQSIIQRHNNNQCVICSATLDGRTLQMQMHDPREMKHHHCGRCWDYHLLMAGAVHGVPEALKVVKTRQSPQLPQEVYSTTPALTYELPQIAHEPQMTVDDVIGQINKPSKVKQLIRRIKS